MPLKSSSISARGRGKRNIPSATQPPRPIDDNSGPDYDGEMQKLAQQSGGTSPFHGHRGLLAPTLVQKFTVAGGLDKHSVPRDGGAATANPFRDEEARAKLEESLDKSVGGPGSRTGKGRVKPKGAARQVANDTTLYG